MERGGGNGVSLFAVERDEYFDRSHLYGGAGGDYFDNASRFIFFSKLVVELARYVEPRPQVIHVNDWQTALVPALVREAKLPYRTVLTVHNLAYQGVFPGYDFALTNLPGSWFQAGGLEFYGRINLLKSGLLAADEVTTVSPSYAGEILTEAYGCGLEGILRERAGEGKLSGILNGIDVQVWNPQADTWIEKGYDAESLKNKKACKKALLAELGWKKAGSDPLAGCISRLVAQKGMDLVLELMPRLLKQGLRFVLLRFGGSEVGAGFF
ncbi:MAG: glycogen synthase [Blastochloris sp.]|nr:glycogen synthase [Blastochloris sp.]